MESTPGHSESLVMRVMTIILTFLLSSPAMSQVVLRDNQSYPSGSYLAYIAPYNKGSLWQGSDYNETISISNSLFPTSTVIYSQWPNVPCSKGVYGFNAIDFGDYYNTIVPLPIKSSKVNKIDALLETHDMVLSGYTDGFDVIDDLFLTSGPGSTSRHLFEVEVFLHTPSYSSRFFKTGRYIGTFTQSSQSWTVVVVPGDTPDVLFMPTAQTDIISAAVNLKYMLDFLVYNKIISGNEYFNGMAFGSETQQGYGTLTINAFSVYYR